VSDAPDGGDGALAARESHVTVPRTARYFTLGDAATAREVWVALHGYGQLASYFVRRFAPLALDRLVVAPEALSRFYLESRTDGAHGTRVGATWMTREDRDAEIADYVRYLDTALDDATRGAALAPLSVLAFSQGTATACRWLAARDRAGAPPAARLILWTGEVPPELDLAAPWLRRTRLTLVHATDDPFATPLRVDEMRERLDAAGVPHEDVTFTGGHRIPEDVLRRVVGD
jgi:predicted esterase